MVFIDPLLDRREKKTRERARERENKEEIGGYLNMVFIDPLLVRRETRAIQAASGKSTQLQETILGP